MGNQAQIRNTLAECVITQLKAGVAPWRFSRGLPTNPATGKRYTGINPLILDAVAEQRNYRSKYWATYHQWQSCGLRVCKRPNNFVGPWGTNIVKWSPHHKFVDKGEVVKLERFSLLETHAVFNASQTFGPTVGKYLQVLNEQVATVDYSAAEAVIAATGAIIRHHNNCQKPKYLRPPEDRILLPSRDRFLNDRQYMATKIHEVIHWCEWRTGWTGSVDQGELIAEIGTGYLEGELELPPDTDMTNHNNWLPEWLKNIEKDPKYLLDAAAQAARVVDYILGFSRE